ncbi:MAG TPA: tetratricopeptide repeat protein, partial [Pyrinomonadaceae bacterium]|nr:tetratricopeptide repeat protein [Pyrinomonadaceae bacterium]
EERQVKQLSLYRGRVETINVDGTPVTIRTARGDVYTLSHDKDNEQEPALDLPARALELIPKPPIIGYVRRSSKRYPDIVRELTEELEPRNVRTAPLIELVGPAGVGKSTIAAEVAREIVDLYAGRVIWLSAEKHSDFNLASMLNGIVTQLGKPELRTLNPKKKTDEVTSLLESEPSVIFVDDFEKVSKGESLRCLRFLQRCDCATVIVSRRLLATRDGRLAIGVTAMIRREASEFLQRLMRRSPAEPVVRNFHDILIEISKGNPLALRLLFAQIEFSAESKAELRNLSTGKNENTLSRILDSSLDLAGPEARPIFFVMALFAPSGSKTAVAEVTDLSEALDHVDEAIDKLTRLGLVYRLDNVERWAVEGSIKAILRGFQSPRQINELRQKYIYYFRRYAEQHNEATSADYDLLEAEFENLLNAMDLAGEFEKWDEAIRIYLALNYFLDVRGYWDIALRRNEQAQSAANMMMRDDLRPQLHQAAGEIYLRRGEFAKAEKAFRSVLTHYGDTVNTDVADATRRLGSIALERENLTKAKRLYSQSLEISRQLKLDASIADNLHNLAIVAQLEGKPDEAMKLYEESLRLSERVGDQRGAAVSLHQLGVVSREQGNYEQARNYFERSLSIKRSLGYREGMADTLHQLGLLYRTLGEKQQAAQPFAQALTLYQELQSPAAAVAASDLATLTTPARAKVTSKRMPSRKGKTKVAKSPAKKTAAKKGAAKKRRIGGISSLFSSRRRKSGGRMGGRFGPRSRKSFR